MRHFLSILMYSRTYVTHKNMISKCICTFFLHMKMYNVLFSFTFSDAYQNVPKAERVRFTCFLDLDLGIASTDDK